MELNRVGDIILDGAFKVHSQLGPGLLESAYQACLLHELQSRDLVVKREVPVPIAYDGLKLDVGFRVDLLVNDKVVVELKAVDKLLPIHMAQVLTYLKLTGCRLGYLLNFNVVHLRDGIKRVVNGL